MRESSGCADCRGVTSAKISDVMKRTPFLLTFAALALLPLAAHAQTIHPDFAGSYSLVSLGTPAGVPGPFGGLTLQAGDPNALLIGGAANGAGGVVARIGLTRENVGGLQRISGFTGTASTYSTAPNIDGGLTYAPNGSLLYTGYSNNIIGEIKPGSTTPDRITTLTGVGGSVGSLLFVPGGAPGAGRLKVLSYSANTWYDLPFAVDGSGLYTFGTPTTSVALGGGLEGAVYVPGGSPLFANPAVLVSEYGNGQIVAYDVDANGDPIASTRRLFVTGLSGAEGAYIDASTGDFLFSTFGGSNQVISVRGFAAVPEPASMAALGLGLAVLASRRRRRA